MAHTAHELPMKKLSEKQQKRRADVLDTARMLIAERGYEGVNMRELAERSGVAVKTLYLHHGSKEDLLTAAIQQAHVAFYDNIDAQDCDSGLDRLFFIVDSITNGMLVDDEYAKTMAPVLLFGGRVRFFHEIRRQTYGKAIQQIADEGDLIRNTSPETITEYILRHVVSTYVEWSNDLLTTEELRQVLKTHICLTLLGLTTGKTKERVTHLLQNECCPENRVPA